LADLDENIIRRSLPFGVDTSIGAVETHASENLILHDSEICDYSDRLLATMVDINNIKGITDPRVLEMMLIGFKAYRVDCRH
jgi:hypothetical protein